MNVRAVASSWPGPHAFCMEWNAENQLTRVTKNTVEQARFKYDPLGRRVEKVAGGVTAQYTHNGGAILRESGSGSTKKYVTGIGVDEPFATEEDSGTLTFYHADGLGSIVKTTNSTGIVSTSRQYDAFGHRQVGATSGGHAFTGREWDPETALYYYRARYYDPKLGRFLTEDPITFRGGVNFYLYVRDNPITRLDPSGLEVQTCSKPIRGMPDFIRHDWICVDGHCGGQEPGVNKPDWQCNFTPPVAGNQVPHPYMPKMCRPLNPPGEENRSVSSAA